jgi:hypothetical protein
LLKEREKRIHDKFTGKEFYHRFNIGPIPHVGPNDFLNVEHVCEKTDEYIHDHLTEFKAIGHRVRSQMGLKPQPWQQMATQPGNL